MRFTVTTASNNSTFGDLFFSVPTQDEMDRAAKMISSFCSNKARKMYGMGVLSRLGIELAHMQKTNTAYHFALLKEIADLSREEGYPIMLEGGLAGSLIAYLLDISPINPLTPHYYCSSYDTFCGYSTTDLSERICPKCAKPMKKDGYDISLDMVWGNYKNPIIPDFSLSIAAPVRPLIHHKLNAKFGFTKAEDTVFNRISLTDSALCENIGRLAKLTGQMPTYKQFGNDVCLQVVRNISQDILEEICEMKENGYITEEEIPYPIPFVEELNQLNRCDFSTLLRLYAYRHGSFKEAKTIFNLSNKHFYVSRDEFYNALISYNVPKDVALKVVEKGVWSIEKTRPNYINSLKEYSVPDYILDYFDKARNLWPIAACLSRLLLMCTFAWYQIYYSVEFSKLENGEL